MSDKKNQNPKPYKGVRFEKLVIISQQIGGEFRFPTANTEELTNIAKLVGGTAPSLPSTTPESPIPSIPNNRDLSEISTNTPPTPAVGGQINIRTATTEDLTTLPKLAGGTIPSPPSTTHESPISPIPNNRNLSETSTDVADEPAPPSLLMAESEISTEILKRSSFQRRKVDTQVSTTQSTIINIPSASPHKKVSEESLKPQEPEKKSKNKGEIQKNNKKEKNKKYRNRKKKQRQSQQDQMWSQFLDDKTSTPTSPATTKLKTAGSEKKSQTPTATLVQNKVVSTMQSTTGLVSSSAPSIASPKPEPTVKLETKTKPPIDKRMDLTPPAEVKEKKQPAVKKIEINSIFFDVSEEILLSCFDDLKDSHEAWLDPVYLIGLTVAVLKLNTHRQITLTFNDSACREYANGLELVQIMLAGLEAEGRIWRNTNEFCKKTISELGSGELPWFSETDLSAMIEQIKVNASQKMVIMSKESSEFFEKKMPAMFAIYQSELHVNRRRAQARLEEITLQLTQAFQKKPPQDLVDLQRLYLQRLYLSKNELNDILEVACENFEKILEKFKLEPEDMDQTTQALADIAYQLTIAFAELKKHYRDFERGKELASNFFNEGRADEKIKHTFSKYNEVKSCELRCIAVYEKHQKQLKEPTPKWRTAFINLVTEVKPLLLLHKKQEPNSTPWMSQEVQKTTWQALNASFIATDAFVHQNEVKKAITKLEQMSVSMKKHLKETAVQKAIKPSLEGLKKLFELYQLSEDLKHNQQMIQTIKNRLQRPNSDKDEDEKAKHKLHTIEQRLSGDIKARFDTIDRYLQTISVDYDLNKSLQVLKHTLSYFSARAFVIVKMQGQTIKALLEHISSSNQLASSSSPIIASPKSQTSNELKAPEKVIADKKLDEELFLESTSTVSELKSEDTPVRDTAERPPKLPAASSRFIGKTPSTQGKGLKTKEPSENDLVAQQNNSPSLTRREEN